MSDYENLLRERSNLLEDLQKNTSSLKQTDDQQQDKLAKLNIKLKRALQIFKEKIHRIATERPDLFANIGEETTERLDHLISTVGHQATQIDQLQNQTSELQRYKFQSKDIFYIQYFRFLVHSIIIENKWIMITVQNLMNKLHRHQW